MRKDTVGKSVPHAIFRQADFDHLCTQDYLNLCVNLGSYWPYSTSNYESRLVRAFKESLPARSFPELGLLCDFYARAIVERLPEGKIDYILRPLSSSEVSADPGRPQGMLLARLCELTGAQDMSDTFFRSQPRPPMRTVRNLSGSGALRTRLKYAAQDLFARSVQFSGRVLLVDDVANTGASMRLYAWVLKSLLGSSEVWGANIAQTRFGGGKDGWGFLELDTAQIQATPEFTAHYLDGKKIFHSTDSCLQVDGKTSVLPLYFAKRKHSPCPHCIDICTLSKAPSGAKNALLTFINRLFGRLR